MNSPANKRTRAAKLALLSTDTDAENNSRVMMDSPFRTFQALDQRFDKLSTILTTTLTETITKLIKTEILQCEQRIIAEVNKNISETEAKLLNEISVTADSLKSDFKCITERVISLESQCSEISALHEEIIEVTERVAQLETATGEIIALKAELKNMKIQALKNANSIVACDLRINGIPHRQEENLTEIFEIICNTINISTPRTKSIFRLQNKNNKAKEFSPDAVIIVKFFSPYDKNFFLKSLGIYKKLNKTNLMLKILGFQSEMPFNINENLTNSNYKIFREAVTLKKRQFLHSAYSFRGLVYVKRAKDDSPTCIDHIDALEPFRGYATYTENCNISAL